MNKRIKNSTINVAVIIVMQIASLFYSLISKRVFLDSFSLSIYGVIDLFESFFRSLMMLELGFGTILIFNLYKPVVNNNKEEIRRQISIFKTVYGVISVIILIISLSALPFIYRIFNISYQDKALVYEIYILNIVGLLIKYYFLNKTSILNASQTNYVQNISTIVTDFIGFIGKIISLLIFNDVYLYVASLLFIPSVSYFFQARWINCHYDVKNIRYASFKTVKSSGILSQMSKYLYATIYDLVFFSMDSIIVSIKLSTDVLAYVSNYLTFINIGGTFAATISLSLRGVMANYKIKENNDDRYFRVFKMVSSLSFFVTSVMIVGFYTMLDNFISLWLGTKFLISHKMLAMLLLIRLLESLCEPISSVFTIGGYMFKEKYPLIISAVLNLTLTIVLIDVWGLFGVYIATFIATFVKWIGKFYYILTDVFKKYKFETIRLYFLYFILIVCESYLMNYCLNLIMPPINSLKLFAVKLFIVVLVTIITDSFVILLDKDVREYLKNYVSSIKKRYDYKE